MTLAGADGEVVDMPGKGRRMASRQAELGRRRRRQNRASAAVAAPPAGPPPNAAPVAEPQRDSTAPAARETPQQQRPAPAPAQPAPSRSRGDRPAAYNYMVPEVRRISIMAGVLLVGLIALSFVIP